MNFVCLYLLIINATSLIVMCIDKEHAKENFWRISERTIFTLTILGGSLGTLLGIYLFRHKTKHISFTVGVPIILSIHILIFVFLLMLL